MRHQRFLTPFDGSRRCTTSTALIVGKGEPPKDCFLCTSACITYAYFLSSKFEFV
ncbi:hypothetical protein K456DRAFT_71966 [Colletotrichum gloeosporioides 23]|nr:hypothetical protein K456DRAFT_71966 [Colletotrichum gloeosporioides 23]